MPTIQGDIGLLNEPMAQRLLQSRIPARLAYVWSDGTPRVVPIGFHWNGREVVLGTPPDAPKVSVLADGAPVALTIDGDEMPYQVLMVRGTTRSDVVNGIAPEYAAMCRRTLGEEGGQAWLDQLAPMCPQMVRISITPTWVGLIDFQTRFPSAVERAMERLQTPT